jgi:hypothetical protein
MRHAAWPRTLARRHSRRVHERQWLTRRSSPVLATQITLEASFFELTRVQVDSSRSCSCVCAGPCLYSVERLWCRQLPRGAVCKQVQTAAEISHIF